MSLQRAVTIRTLQEMKQRAQRISMLTCYDATFARLLDEGEVDVMLVGDSLGMVVKGEDNTLAVTVDEIAYHVRAVARGTRRAHIVGDMPFLSYQASVEEAIKNAGKLLQHGAHSVKLEGGADIAPTVERLVAAGIPVMGHVGLLPQSVHAQGGFVVQGRDKDSKQRIIDDALALEAAGAYAIVLEGIPGDVAVEITSRLTIPTIGIGAGAGCDGQVLVLYDLLGLDPSFKPKFVRRFMDGHGLITDAVRAYVGEVQAGRFPALEHTFGSKPPTPTVEAEPTSGGYGPREVDEPQTAQLN
jgi:3-methyl-2-oxobutanoate hydroxymethyltransferase